jgi:hypothetical protein
VRQWASYTFPDEHGMEDAAGEGRDVDEKQDEVEIFEASELPEKV